MLEGVTHKGTARPIPSVFCFPRCYDFTFNFFFFKVNFPKKMLNGIGVTSIEMALWAERNMLTDRVRSSKVYVPILHLHLRVLHS